MDKFYIEKLKIINHWNKSLISFKCTRNKFLKFKNGEFLLIGFLINNNIIYKAYSIISSYYDEFIEFLSIKIKLGILSKNFFNIKTNYKILLSKKISGSLLLENLNLGKNLWLISTGTGVSPFLSIIKLNKIYKIYNKIIFIYVEKNKENLSYYFFLKKKLLFKSNKNNIIYFYFIITREFYYNFIKFNDVIIYNILFKNLNIKNIKFYDRFLICCNNNNIKNLNYILNKIFYISKLNFLFERSFLDF